MRKNRHKKYNWLYFALIGLLVLTSCQKNYSPRPLGYFRIDFPDKAYQTFNSHSPYSFEYPQYAQINEVPERNDWYNIDMPEFGATIYLTYKPISNNLDQHIEDVRGMAYKHIVKANNIQETLFRNDTTKVYGILYDISGNTASAVNFFATDSISNFISGSLYFNASPNRDSLQPAIMFFRDDVLHIMQTLKWK